MTANADIVNLALQNFGSRTTVTDAELTNNSTNEAIQANLTYDNTRDSLLRMAPWDCAFAAMNLIYITSVPGTPENTSPATNLWQPGQPMPPWAYEYQYPVDCLRACWVIPSIQTGQTSGIPITTAVTGYSSIVGLGGPIRFKVQTDQFYPVTAAAIAAGGTGHAVGDLITLPYGASDDTPIGAPVVLLVTAVTLGVITAVSVVNQVPGSDPKVGGSYFATQTNPVAQDTTTGSGIDATFNLTFGSKGNQRVILTNQEYATLAFIRQVTDHNVWDPLFQDAMASKLGADLAIALTGDKGLADMCIKMANAVIMEARNVDGNEGLTINDITPDWVRGRGFIANDIGMTGPAFDWGNLLPVFS